MDLTERLNEAMNPHEVFSIGIPKIDFSLSDKLHIKIPHFEIPVTDTVIVMWVIMAFLAVFTFVFTRKLKEIPDGKQNLIETIIEFINNFAKNMIGHHGKDFTPYLGTILLFLAMSNIISIFNVIPSGEWLSEITGVEGLKHIPHLKPPTKDVNVTAAMALMSIVLVIISGIKYKKLSGWLKDFIKPIPIILPFKILDYFIRPLSLCFRLFGNILGAFIIMEMLYIAMPVILPAFASIYFDLFDGLLQAYIFVFLTSLYIAEAVEE